MTDNDQSGDVLRDAAKPTDSAFLIHWLSDRDEPCPLCKYNLRGLTRPVCPECGNDLRLSVSLADPYLKGWILLAASLLLPAGLGLLWALMVPVKGMPRGRDGTAAPAIFYQIVAIPLAVLVGLRRKQIQRWPRGRQHTVAAVSTLACVISFILLYVTFCR